MKMLFFSVFSLLTAFISTASASIKAEALRQMVGYEIDEKGFTRGSITLRPGIAWPVEKQDGPDLILLIDGKRIKVPSADFKISDVTNPITLSRPKDGVTDLNSRTIETLKPNTVYLFKCYPFVDEDSKTGRLKAILIDSSVGIVWGKVSRSQAKFLKENPKSPVKASLIGYPKPGPSNNPGKKDIEVKFLF